MFTTPRANSLSKEVRQPIATSSRLVPARGGICTAIAFAASVAYGLAVSTAAAQGGMGGMGGGMRGGGGGRGGMGRMPSGGGMQSPVDAIKDNLKENDPLKFLLDRKKPLDLTKAQKDTIERYRKEMEDAQRPVYKDMEKLAADMPRGRGGMGRGGEGGMGGGERGGGMGGMGGERGGMGGGGGERGGERGGRGSRGGDENPDSTAGGRGGRGPAGPFREYADKLSDIQDAFRDRARAQLTDKQRVTADSLQTVWLAEQRKKAEEKRDERRDRRGN